MPSCDEGLLLHSPSGYLPARYHQPGGLSGGNHNGDVKSPPPGLS